MGLISFEKFNKKPKLKQKLAFFRKNLLPLLLSLCFVLGAPCSILCQNQNVSYSTEKFFINEGLPVIRIYDIVQDQKGLMWVCTESGLFSFNGNEFELKIDFGEINYYPNKIFFDLNKNIWLVKYKYANSAITLKSLENLVIFNPKLESIDLGNYVGSEILNANQIVQSKNGTIFFDSIGQSYSFDTKKNKLSLPVYIQYYLYQDKNYTVVNDSTDVVILNSKTNKIEHKIENRIASYVENFKDGLIMQLNTGHFLTYNKKDKVIFLSERMNGAHFFNHIIDKDESIWTINKNSIEIFNTNFKKEDINLQSYIESEAYLTKIYKDREDNIWVGSNQGLYKLTLTKNEHFESSFSFGKSSRALIELNNKELFVSTYDGNYIYNIENQKINQLAFDNVMFSGFSEDNYYYTSSDKNIYKISASDHKVISKKTFASKTNNLPTILVRLSDTQKLIMLDNSINSFDDNLNISEIFKDDKCIFYNLQLIRNKLYLSTNKGLKVFNSSFEIIESYLPDNRINYVHQDLTNSDVLWLATSSYLIRFDTKTQEQKLYDTNDGFINSIFTSIKEDEFGHLWLPSFAGLNLFHKKTEENKVYWTESGIPNTEFNNYSSTVLSNGRYAFGGVLGLTFVNPYLLEDERIRVPEIEIYECIKINSKNNIDVTKQVEAQNKIIVNEHDVLTKVKIAHYSYTSLNSKVFQYRIIDPIKKDTIVPWVKLKSNELQLGRIPYGTYDLQFQAISRSGDKLSDINNVELEYITPFLETNLFKVIALLFTAGLIYLLLYVRSQSLIQQQNVLKEEVELRTIQIQSQKEELERINHTKDKLFSILAHDLKSPLITLKNISGKINFLIKKNQHERILEIGKTIEDKVSNLSVFLDNLLNWSLQQRGHLSYTPKKMELSHLTEDILLMYEDQIKEKNLKVNNKIREGSICFADNNSIHAVIRNLISNSIKYSPQGEEITIDFKSNEIHNIYSISDNGMGIDKETLKSIYRNENIQSVKGTKGESGTGLGLVISKELIELNKGYLRFLPSEKSGTTVEVHLPKAISNLEHQ